MNNANELLVNTPHSINDLRGICLVWNKTEINVFDDSEIMDLRQ
jgi:hypothetical protein